MSSLVDAKEWSRLLARLDRAGSDHERLAILGHFIDLNEQVIRSHLPADERRFIAGLDAHAGDRSDLLDALGAALTSATAAHASVACTMAFDRQLAAEADFRAGATGEETEVHWGPYDHGESGPLFLTRWPRQASLPIDDQGLTAKVLAHHRVLGRGPGGISWDLSRLGGSLSPGRRANIALLLGRSRSNWPIRIAVWPGSDVASRDFTTRGGCVVVDPDGRTADEVVGGALEAVAYAEKVEAHLLVAPELYVPEARIGEVAAHLGSAGRRGAPVLSILGLTHRARGDGWANEAVVLDYEGTELWRHTKTAAFAKGDSPGECLRVGRTAALRYSPAGWMMVLICLDLFAQKPREAILQAAPALVLAPSLSRSTSAHQNAAREAQASGIAMVVANRPLDVPYGSAPSFFSGNGELVTLDRAGFADWMPGSASRRGEDFQV